MTGGGRGLIETFHFLLLLCTFFSKWKKKFPSFFPFWESEKDFHQGGKNFLASSSGGEKDPDSPRDFLNFVFSLRTRPFPIFLRPQKKIGQATGKSRRHVFPAVASGHRKGGEKKERIRANYLGVGGEGGAILINVFPSSSSSIFFRPEGGKAKGARARVCLRNYCCDNRP